MSDRVSFLTVALTKDYRDEDVQSIIGAIMMIKGVQGVTANVVTADDWANRERVRHELMDKLYECFQSEP